MGVPNPEFSEMPALLHVCADMPAVRTVAVVARGTRFAPRGPLEAAIFSVSVVSGGVASAPSKEARAIMRENYKGGACTVVRGWVATARATCGWRVGGASVGISVRFGRDDPREARAPRR